VGSELIINVLRKREYDLGKGGASIWNSYDRTNSNTRFL